MTVPYDDPVWADMERGIRVICADDAEALRFHLGWLSMTRRLSVSPDANLRGMTYEELRPYHNEWMRRLMAQRKEKRDGCGR